MLAGKLAELQDISGDQLTTAERQLKAAEAQVKALDGMQAQGRAMLESLSGNVTATLSVRDAIAQLGAAVLDAAGSATTAATAPPTTVVPANPGATAPPTTVVPAKPGASPYWTPVVIDGQNLFADPGGSIWDSRTIEMAKTMYGLPSFAVGTNYVPRDMLAQIHEGEAIVPKAYNPAAGGGSSNAKLEGLVEALTSEVKRLQTVVNDGNREQRRTANAVNGNPDMPMLVQTV